MQRSILIKSLAKQKLFRPGEIPKEFDIESRIKIASLEYLYFGNSKQKKIPSKEISCFIDRKQESLTLNDFLFAKGLAGFGNMILSTNTTINKIL